MNLLGWWVYPTHNPAGGTGWKFAWTSVWRKSCCAVRASGNRRARLTASRNESWNHARDPAPTFSCVSRRVVVFGHSASQQRRKELDVLTPRQGRSAVMLLPLQSYLCAFASVSVRVEQHILVFLEGLLRESTAGQWHHCQSGNNIQSLNQTTTSPIRL